MTNTDCASGKTVLRSGTEAETGEVSRSWPGRRGGSRGELWPGGSTPVRKYQSNTRGGDEAAGFSVEVCAHTRKVRSPSRLGVYFQGN